MSELKINVGDFAIHHSDREASSELPGEIFFKHLTDHPYVYRSNFLSPEEIKLLYEGALEGFPRRNYASVHDYSKGVTAAKVDTNGRYTHFIPCEKKVYDLLEQKLVDGIYSEISHAYDVSGTFKRSEGWQVLGYGVGYFFSNHCDNCVGGSLSPEKRYHEQPWWCNTPNRKFTVIMYLNDQSDDYAPHGTYSGGALSLTRVRRNGQVVTFRPRAGDLVCFPSNYLFQHEVQPVTRGYRFSCVTWIDVV